MKPAIDKLTDPETIEGYRLWESLPRDEQQRYMDWTPREVLVFKPLIDEMAGRRELRFVIDGPPGRPESGRFVELENERGESIAVGEWRERPDGLWELVVSVRGVDEPESDE